MKTHFISLLIFSAVILFAGSGCESKADKCFREYTACYTRINQEQQQNSKDWQDCVRAALDAQRDGLKNCQELPDANARAACINRITAECERAIKKCDDDYEKKAKDLQAEMDACIDNWSKCLKE